MIEKFTNGYISLSRLQKNDAVEIYLALKNSINEISPWLSWLTPDYDLKSANNFINLQTRNWDKNSEYTFAIRDPEQQFLGVISLHMFDSANDVANIGYWIDSSLTNHGYCTQALKLLVENTLTQLNLIRIEVIVALSNSASQKVAEKAGATYEATLKNRIRSHGLPLDAKVYGFFI